MGKYFKRVSYTHIYNHRKNLKSSEKFLIYPPIPIRDVARLRFIYFADFKFISLSYEKYIKLFSWFLYFHSYVCYTICDEHERLKG